MLAKPFGIIEDNTAAKYQGPRKKTEGMFSEPAKGHNFEKEGANLEVQGLKMEC